jgi:hypothetical protein
MSRGKKGIIGYGSYMTLIACATKIAMGVTCGFLVSRRCHIQSKLLEMDEVAVSQ